LENTREFIQKELADWANDGAEGLTAFWLSGMAGTGKTAIAKTFASSMAEEGILGATFFIDRQQAERRDLKRIVQTLAYDLGKHSHAQLQAMRAVVYDDPIFDRLPFENQARLLIEKPLNSDPPQTLVVVIDGLDECGVSEGVSLVKTLVKSLAHHPIKLFVSSRNEVDIANVFRNIAHRSIKLQEIEVSDDVGRYWKRRLDDLYLPDRVPDWQSVVTLERLVEITGNLFIYATTILEIIMDVKTDRIQKLGELLEISGPGSVPSAAFNEPDDPSPLEQLYKYIISEAVKNRRGIISTEYVGRLHSILEVVIFAREPLTRQAFSDLLDMDRNELDSYLSSLCSVLELPDAFDPDGVVRVMHQSFPDFVCEQGGLVHPKLTIDATFTELHLAERCIIQLYKRLHFNMCDLHDPSLFNDEISDLEARLRQYLIAALRYSCRFWIMHWLAHIRAAGSQAQLPDGLDDFCAEHLLHWIEVLSLIKSLPAVQGGTTELMVDVLVRCFTL
jgi:hypothetical protein